MRETTMSTHLRIVLAAAIGLILLLLGWPATDGQPAKQKAPAAEFECRFAATPIKINGKGTDPAWKNAQTIDNFYLPWLGDKARPGEDEDQGETALGPRVPLLLRRHGGHRPLRRRQGARRQALEQRRLRAVLQAGRRQAGLLRIPGQPGRGGARLFLPRRGAGGFDRFKNDGDFHVDAKVNLRGTLNNWTDKDDGWSVEGKIPWTDFLTTGGRPEPGEKWKFALCRYDYSVDFEGPELSTCAPLTKPNFHQFEDYATLRFVGPEKTQRSRAGSTSIPLTTSQGHRLPRPPPPYPGRARLSRHADELPAHHRPHSRLRSAARHLPAIAATGDDDDPPHEGRSQVKAWELWLDSADTVYQIEFHPKLAENGYVYIGSNGAAIRQERRRRQEEDAHHPLHDGDEAAV